MMNGPATYKAIAEALPWEIRSALLSIRDEGMTTEQMPLSIYAALYEMMLVESDGETKLRLSRLGKHLVDYCTC